MPSFNTVMHNARWSVFATAKFVLQQTLFFFKKIVLSALVLLVNLIISSFLCTALVSDTNKMNE